jgi:crotonobetainyl-CoA:carnitine CoA-transferase CaiB-like acyl-CoA transferase
MGAPEWARDERYATNSSRLEHQETLDGYIEAWTGTLDKYDITASCQAAGVRAMAVQSAADRVEHDAQLRHRGMYQDLDHPALGRRKVQNAPFKLSATPAFNHCASPLIGQHTAEIVEGLLGCSREELREGFVDGTFWPTKRPRFDYLEDMLK